MLVVGDCSIWRNPDDNMQTLRMWNHGWKLFKKNRSGCDLLSRWSKRPLGISKEKQFQSSGQTEQVLRHPQAPTHTPDGAYCNSVCVSGKNKCFSLYAKQINFLLTRKEQFSKLLPLFTSVTYNLRLHSKQRNAATQPNITEHSHQGQDWCFIFYDDGYYYLWLQMTAPVSVLVTVMLRVKLMSKTSHFEYHNDRFLDENDL